MMTRRRKLAQHATIRTMVSLCGSKLLIYIVTVAALFGTTTALTDWQALYNQVQAVANLTDGVMRNYQITQSYAIMSTFSIIKLILADTISLQLECRRFCTLQLMILLVCADMPSWYKMVSGVMSLETHVSRLIDLLDQSAQLGDIIFGFLLETTSNYLAAVVIS